MKYCSFLILCSFVIPVFAREFPLPENNDSLIGEDQIVYATDEDTLVDIARNNGLGFEEIVDANPSVDVWLPRKNTAVKLPLRFLLPDAPRDGIVINVAEMRLYYFPKAKRNEPAAVQKKVQTFPISVGRSDWNTPLVKTKVTRKVTNPVWYPPKSVRDEHEADGDPLPAVVKSGPDNPLGQYALYLGTPSYLIHGTNKEFGIGMQVTHGCIRLYPEDIRHLYETVKPGTQVEIVNQPYKVGWLNGVLYMEAHPWLEGTTMTHDDKTMVRQLIENAIKDVPEYRVNWNIVDVVRVEATGEPIAIGEPAAISPQITPDAGAEN